jgi:antitoxin ParD1/3/4
MTSMNVSLPEELKQFAEEQAQHRYSTPSEYIRELIREDQKRKAKEKLDALLLEGLASGESIRADAKFWAELRQDALTKLQSQKKTLSKR